jgi:hypothetical protein
MKRKQQHNNIHCTAQDSIGEKQQITAVGRTAKSSKDAESTDTAINESVHIREHIILRIQIEEHSSV